MRSSLQFRKLLVVTTLAIFALSGGVLAQSLTDEFNRPDGPLGGGWASNANLVIQSGKMHNSSATTTKDIAIFNDGLPSDPNIAAIQWASNATDPGFGGVIFASSYTSTPSGYFIQYYSNQVRLYKVEAGTISTTALESKSVALQQPSPGFEYKVQFNPGSHSFTVFLNGTSAATVTDGARTYTPAYVGALLYGGGKLNDIEKFTAAYQAPTGDVTAPAAVTTLSVSSKTATSVTLAWTATGDDGNSGTAGQYDLRYSPNAITAANFGSATRDTGTPVPKAAGSNETFTVSNLSANTTYHFAIKVGDEVPNWSGISNVVNTTTSEQGEPLPSVQWSCNPSDGFERATPGPDWAAPNFVIESGELAVNPGITGSWNLAVYTKYYKTGDMPGLKMSMNMGANADKYGNAVPVGIGILLDAPAATADGYWLRRTATELICFRIVGGADFSIPVTSTGVSQAVPDRSDKVSAEVYQTGTNITVVYFVNDQEDAQLSFTVPTAPGTWYAGVVAYEDGTSNYNVDDFTICTEGAGGASKIVKYHGDNQSGPINQTLPDSIAVKLTDNNDNPVPGVVVDFNILQGQATLSVDDVSAFDGRIWRECEDGNTAGMAQKVEDATASGGRYVTTPYLSGQRWSTALTIPVYTPEARNYYFYLRYRTDSNSRNRIFLKYSDTDSIDVEVTNYTSQWTWHKAASSITLEKGVHFLKFVVYEPGWDWDKIALIDRALQGPAGSEMGGTGPVFPNVANDDGIAATYVTFKTDADTNVVVEASALAADGLTILSTQFTLDPLPGPADTIKKDPDLPDPMIGTPGAPLPDPLTAIITDQYGNRVPNVQVSWQILLGQGATLNPNPSISDQAGEAITTMTLGFTDTLYQVQGSSAGLTGSPISFDVRAGEPPKEMQYVDGDNQEIQAGMELLEPLIVKIIKQDNSPFVNYPVEFTVTEGNGKVSAESPPVDLQTTVRINTDSNGEAKVWWTLGAKVGINNVRARAAGILPGSPYTFTAEGTLGPPQKLVIDSGNEQHGPIGLPLPKPLVVRVTDEYDNPIPGYQVTFDILDGTGAYLETPGTLQKTVFTSAEGKAQVILVMGSQQFEVNRVRATATNLTPETVTFEANARPPVASELLYISGAGQDTTVGNRLSKPFVVKVLGPYDSIISNHPVLFKVIKGGGNFGGASEITVNSNAEGLASAILTVGLQAGDSINVVEARSFRIDIPDTPLEGSPVTFKATTLPGPPANLVKDTETDNQSGANGRPLTKALRVQVTDIHGNAIEGHTVTFEVVGGGGTFLDGAGESTVKVTQTGTDGYATADWRMPVALGTWTVRVTAVKDNGAPLTGSPAEFKATSTPGLPEKMEKWTMPDTLVGVVGKVLSQKLRVRITDENGLPYGNYHVSFVVTEGGGLVNGLQTVTVPTSVDAGIAEVAWTLGTKSGVDNNLVEARAAVNVNPTLVFKATALPDVPSRLVEDKTAKDQIHDVGAVLPKPIKVQIVDQYGNGVPGHPVVFRVMGVDSLRGSIDGLPEKTLDTDAEGYAQVNWTLGKYPGSRNNVMEVSSRFNGVHLTNSPYTFYASGIITKPDIILMASDTTKLIGTIGNLITELLKVKVTDKYGNPIANHEVTFEVMSTVEANGGSLDGPTDNMKIKKTDTNGMAWVQFTCGKNAGYKINRVEARAEYNKVNLTNSPITFYITAMPTRARKIEMLTGNNQAGTVGQYLPIELQVVTRDEYGNPIQNHPVQFRVIAGGGFLGSDSLQTMAIESGAGGVARVKWCLGEGAGVNNNIVEASSTDGTKPLAGSPVTFKASADPDITSAGRSTIQSFPAEVPADGQTKATIIVTLRDRFDNAVMGKAVILTATGMNNSITNPYLPTDANGQATGYITSTRAETKWIKAFDVNNQITIGDSAQVKFSPLDAYDVIKPSSNHGDSQIRNKGTVLPQPLVVIVRDRYNNPIAKHRVTFVTTGTNHGQVLDYEVLTDSTGTARARYRLSENEGVNYVEARANDATDSPLVNSPVRFTEVAREPMPSRLVKSGGDNQQQRPRQPLPNPLIVKVVDVNGWEIWGMEVKFDVLHNNGAITSTNPVRSNMFGEASVTAMVGTIKGTNIFSASLPSYPSIEAVTFMAETKADQASRLVFVCCSEQKGTVNQTLAQPFQVRTTDDQGNPVENVPVTFSVVEDASVQGVGLIEGGKTYTTNSNSEGLASCLYQLGKKAGINKVRATGANLQPTFVEFLCHGEATYPYAMELYDSNNLKGPANKNQQNRPMTKPVQVLFKDIYGNPARGGVVNFIVLPGSGRFVEAQPVLSGADGIAKVHWILGKIGKNDGIATASLPSGSVQIPFMAIGEDNYYPELALPAGPLYAEPTKQLCFAIIANDLDGDQLFYSASNIPLGATFDAEGSKLFCWTPEISQGRSDPYTVVFTVWDHKGGDDVDSMKIYVAPKEVPPEITVWFPLNPIVSVPWGTKKQFSVTARDDNDDPIYYSWTVDAQTVNNTSSYELNSQFYSIGSTHIVRVIAYDQTGQDERVWSVNISKVEMKSFAGSVSAFDGVTLSWETASESGNLGFNVHRSRSENGDYVKINEALIPANDEGKYTYQDKNVEAGLRYYYKIEDVDVNGQLTKHGPVMAEMPLPQSYELSQNYPNPFNPATTIRYQLPAVAHVRLEIYNITGQLIRMLVDGEIQAGHHDVIWDGCNDRGMRVGSGVYYYRLVAGDFSEIKKMALLR